MNCFFDKDISQGMKKHEKLMDLIARVDADPSVLFELSLAELLEVDAYYDEKSKELDKKIES